METLHAGLLASIDERFTLLVANRRAAHALKLAYAEQVVTAGRSAWLTPDVLTFRTWAERTWLACRGQNPQRLLSRRQALVLWERIVSASPAGRSLLNPASAAAAAARSWDLAQEYNIALTDIAAHGGEEADIFVDWTMQFEQMCADRGWLPPGALAQVLASYEPFPLVNLHLIRLDPPTPAEAALLDRVVAAGGIVRRNLPDAPVGSVSRCEARDTDHELELAAQWAYAQLQAGCRSIGIVVPLLAERRHAVRRVFEEAFVPASRRSGQTARNVPFTISASGRLDEFPLVRAVLDILRLVEGRAPSTLAGALLRSPFLAGFEQESANRARTDAALRQESIEYVDVFRLERLAATHDCPLLAHRLANLRPLLPRADEMLSVSRWAERFLKILTGCGWPGDRIPNSEEKQTLAKLSEALSEFGSLEDLLGPISFHMAYSEFERWVATIPYEPQAPPAPVTVIDFDAVAGTRFDALWVVGCEASRWPPAPEPDPFLPLPLQRRAGIPAATADDCRERSWRQFAALRTAAAAVVFSWPQFEADAEQAPSPLLASIPPYAETVAKRPRLREWLQSRRPTCEIITDAMAPPVEPGPIRGGTRVVELQSWCPFRAQAELRLVAVPLAQVAPGIDARDRGTLLHRALEVLWNELRDHEGLQIRTAEQIERRIREVLDSLSVPLLKGASRHRARLVAIEVAIATRKLGELLALERTRQPFRVLERPEFVQRYRSAGLELELAIDRVDVLEEEGYRLQVTGKEVELRAAEGVGAGEVVIDYKTGTSAQPTKWWGTRPEQPQLPLYAVARRRHLAAVSFALLNARETCFRGIARETGILPGIKAHPASQSVPAASRDWEEMLDDWQQTIDALIAGFAHGDARVEPLPRLCERCHLTSFCRIHEHPLAGESP